MIVELIGATMTQAGLRVRAELDRGRYPLGVKVGDAELAAVPLERHRFHGEWNYTVHPSLNRWILSTRSSHFRSHSPVGPPRRRGIDGLWAEC